MRQEPSATQQRAVVVERHLQGRQEEVPLVLHEAGREVVGQVRHQDRAAVAGSSDGHQVVDHILSALARLPVRRIRPVVAAERTVQREGEAAHHTLGLDLEAAAAARAAQVHCAKQAPIRAVGVADQNSEEKVRELAAL